MRLSPHTGKDGCRLIDFVDSHNRVGEDLAVHPSLFGLDPNMIDEDSGESLTVHTSIAHIHPTYKRNGQRKDR